MSGIYAVLFTQSYSGAWLTQLDKMISGIRCRGGDGTRTVALNESFEVLPSGRLYSRSKISGGSLIGCAYSWPISLSEADSGPFISDNGKLALAYDGVVSDYNGSQLTERLTESDATESWAIACRELDGQFALLVIDSKKPKRIYYAVKAKPLYVLFDSRDRGVIISSSREVLRGQYHPTRHPQPIELNPYTCGYITVEGTVTQLSSLVRWPGEGTLVLSGGGLDTLVAAFDSKRNNPSERMELVYFNYGAKSSKQEQLATERIASALSMRYTHSATTWRAFDFPLLGQLAASSLIDSRIDVSKDPRPGRASEWVPARNTVLMSLALAYAESAGYARIVTGINPDAATAYPDNDEAWNERMQAVVPYALGTDRFVRLEAPLRHLSKVGIVQRGAELKIPWKKAESWSCYDGGELHCGQCSSCRARRKAFEIANVQDPTEYEP